MKKKLLFVSLLALAVLSLSGCNKRCRCIKYNNEVDYFTKEEVSALGKTCSEMRYMEGLAAQRYTWCEWVYGE